MVERDARAHFRVIRINRWTLALVAIAVLAALALPVGRLLPAGDGGDTRVQPGVTFLGRDIGGLAVPELRQFLAELAPSLWQAPVAARTMAPSGQPAFVVPEASGLMLDVAATTRLALSAPPGSKVTPAMTAVPAVPSAADYPQLPIYSANPGRRAVGLLVNVAWGEEYLPTMLATLRDQQVRATFFLVGRWAEKHPDLVRQIRADGHELANHGYDDRRDPFDLARTGKLKEDIQKADAIIAALAGGKSRFFSPHKGQVNDAITRTAAELGYRTVLWSLDTVDWQAKSAADITTRVLGKVEGGDLILMHPTAATREALPEIVRDIAARGLECLTLSELLGAPPAPAPAAPGGGGAP